MDFCCICNSSLAVHREAQGSFLCPKLPNLTRHWLQQIQPKLKRLLGRGQRFGGEQSTVLIEDLACLFTEDRATTTGSCWGVHAGMQRQFVLCPICIRAAYAHNAAEHSASQRSWLMIPMNLFASPVASTWLNRSGAWIRVRCCSSQISSHDGIRCFGNPAATPHHRLTRSLLHHSTFSLCTVGIAQHGGEHHVCSSPSGWFLLPSLQRATVVYSF